MNDQDALVAEAVNEASFAAANLVFDYAATKEKRKEYEPLDALASRVQKIVVKVAAKRLREGTKF